MKTGTRDPAGKSGPRSFRALVRGGVAGLLLSQGAMAGSLAGTPNQGAPVDLGLGAVANFPQNIAASLDTLLTQGLAAPGAGTVARPSLGALSARDVVGRLLDQRLKIPGAMAAVPLPEAFSVVMWVRISPNQKSALLFGFGDPEGDYLVAATDSSGAPMLAFLNREKISQMNRAGMAPANITDDRLHVVVAVVNLGSGLARLYVDGRPEAASTISLWRPRQLGPAFACDSLQGKTSVSDTDGLLMPRIIWRELTEDEIGKIKPGTDGFDQDFAAIDAQLGLRLAKDTLVEFWPYQCAYLLRRRPL